jgi:hypothetical protein
MVENNLKATHKDKTPTITKALILFCEKSSSVKPPVPIAVESLSVKARNIATKLLVECEENKTIMEVEEAEALKLHLFSSTWCFKWLKRNIYMSKELHGEAADVDLIGVADAIAKLREEISKYPPEHVYNMDETGLKFRLLPRQTSMHKTEKNVRGSKSMKYKDCVTLYTATNATGSQKVPLSMIGNSKHPRCFG